MIHMNREHSFNLAPIDVFFCRVGKTASLSRAGEKSRSLGESLETAVEEEFKGNGGIVSGYEREYGPQEK
jgi:hypothetical protein